MRLRKPSFARIALAVVWVFALEMITTAGGELVRITSPKDGEQAKGRIRVDAETKVENPGYLIFCVDGARPHSTNVQPYYFELDTTALADGPHALAAEVYGRQGLLGRSSPVTIRVANAPASPEPQALAQQPAAPAEPTRAAREQGQAAPNSAPPASAAATDAKASAARPHESQVLTPVLVLGPQMAAAPAPQRDSTRPPALVAGPARERACPSSPQAQRQGQASPACGVVTVILDKRALSFDVAPAVCEGRIFGALRTVIEQSGGNINWLAAAKQAVAERAGTHLRVTVGSPEANVDGRVIDLGAAVKLQAGRTMVPLRTTCEPLGYAVLWAADSHTVQLCSAVPKLTVGELPAR